MNFPFAEQPSAATWLVLGPLVIQGLLIVIDEFVFHRQRGLPQWERWGHPIDTLCFLACCILAAFNCSPSVYLLASVVSCLMITKDEWVHQRQSSGSENWIHALLFVIHPVVLFSIWQLRDQPGILRTQTLLVTLVLGWQVFYWILLPALRNQKVPRRPSKSTISHLRFKYSLFMTPVFFLCLAETQVLDIPATLLLFAALTLGTFPASNGYNSYYDRDEESIGGLLAPPPVTSDLLFYSVLIELIATLAVLVFIGWQQAALLIGYGLFSRLYSHPFTRLKSRPLLSFIVVAFWQGAAVFWLCASIMDPNFHDLTRVWQSERLQMGALVSSLLIGGSYILTQIYQHAEDERRGDRTLSRLLGVRGSFTLAGLLLGSSMIALALHWGLSASTLVLLLVTAPVGSAFMRWLRLAWKNSGEANFVQTQRFLKLSAFFSILSFMSIFMLRQFAFAQPSRPSAAPQAETIKAVGGPPVLLGTASVKVGERPWFAMQEASQLQGKGTVYKVKFSVPGGETLSNEEATVSESGRLQHYSWQQNQTSESAEVQLQDHDLKMKYCKSQVAAVGRSADPKNCSEDTVKLSDEEIDRLVVPPLLRSYLVAHWEKALPAGRLNVLVVAPDLQTTFNFHFTPEDSKTWVLTPNNIFVSIKVKPITFVFDAEKHLQEIRQMSPPVRFPAPNGLESRVTDITFTERHEL